MKRILSLCSFFFIFIHVSFSQLPDKDQHSLSLPFIENFKNGVCNSRWIMDTSKGNTIIIKEGVMEIRARQNTYAHIEHPLNVDFIRITCEVKPAPAISWCTGLFVYWSPDNWIGYGIIDRGGGMFFSTQMINGKHKEYEMGSCPFGEWQYIRMELGVDFVKYLSSSDGTEWKREAITRRKDNFSSTPTLIAFGKGFSSGTGNLADPDLDNDYTEPGEMGASFIRNITVQQLAYKELKASGEDKAELENYGIDALGKRELENDSDSTFDSVSSFFPPMKFPREIVGVKDHPHDIGVTADASLQLSDDITNKSSPVAYFTLEKNKLRFGENPSQRQKRLYKGYLPIITASYTNPETGLIYEEMIFGYSEDLSPDKDLFAYIRFKVANPGNTDVKTELSFFVDADSQKKEIKTWKLDLPSNSKKQVFITVPFDIKNQVVEEIEQKQFDQILEKVEQYWEELLKFGASIHVPEERVNNALKAWLAYSFMDVDKHDSVLWANDGAGFYECPYGYSAALYCVALDMMGYHDYAREILDSLLTFQQSDGLIYINFGFTDTGAMLFALSEHFRFTRDGEWLKTVAPKMISMCNWITENRKESMKMIHFGKSPVYGLVRFRPYCDFQMPAYDLFGNCYLCVGMERAAKVFEEIGLFKEAEKIGDEARSFREDILNSMDASVVRKEGIAILPIHPDTQQILKDTNYEANGYYGLVASCLLESEFLPPFDPRISWLKDPIEKRGGLILGSSAFYNSIDHAYTFGYLRNCFLQDEVKKVILGFYSFLAYGMSQETYSGVEVTNIRTGENYWTLPHLYSCTQQIRLLRMMLIDEEDRNLNLCFAIPRHWLNDGDTIDIRNAPTLFGAVSFNIKYLVSSGKILVNLTPPERNTPDKIRIRLRTPHKLNVKEVRSDNSAVVRFNEDIVECHSLKKPIKFEVLY